MDEFQVIIPEYLDNPFTDAEIENFLSDDVDLNSQSSSDAILQDNQFLQTDIEKEYYRLAYEKTLQDYNAIVEEQEQVNSNYLNQIANCSFYILAFVGCFVLFYLLGVVIKFAKSLIDF